MNIHIDERERKFLLRAIDVSISSGWFDPTETEILSKIRESFNKSEEEMRIEIGNRYVISDDKIGFCFAKKDDKFLFAICNDTNHIYQFNEEGISMTGLKLIRCIDDKDIK